VHPMGALLTVARKPLVLWLLVPLVILAAAGGGYLVGIRQGAHQRALAIQRSAEEQFRLAQQDLAQGRFEMAKQRLEYVARIDPTYPGVPELLAQALLALNKPTSAPTIQATPTPNLAPVAELFEQAQSALGAQDWTLAIDTLVALRAKDPAYQAIEVDRMLFIALRNRGVQRIEKEGELAEGLYDLSRAEQFGPLDRDAETWRSWAELYMLANSYMGLNWGQAALYFGQLYAMAPYLNGDTYLKYARSSQAYGDELYQAKDPCAATDYYANSLGAWENQELVPTATKAAKACMTATAPAPPPPPPSESTPTPTPNGGTSEAEATPTPTPTNTPES